MAPRGSVRPVRISPQFLHLNRDILNNHSQLLMDMFIREAKESNTQRLNGNLPLSIIFLDSIMRRPIQLNRQFHFSAKEVQNEISNAVLSAEFGCRHLRGANSGP